MRLTMLCGRLSRDAYCHVPADVPFDPSRLVSEAPERWSDPGEPTIYLAGDPGVALAELGRHRSRLPGQDVERRVIVRVHVSLDRVVDLTRPETLDALSLPGPWVFADRGTAGDVAREVRRSGDCEAMLVPSIAFLDRPERRNLVVFAERLNGGVTEAIGAPVQVGEVRLWPAATGGEAGTGH